MQQPRPHKSQHWLALTLIISAVFISHGALSDVYKTVDKDGRVTFSDQAEEQATEITIPTINTTPAVAVPKQASTELLPVIEEEAVDIAYQLRISAPQNDGIIQNGLVPFNVSTQLSPALAEGHQLQLTIDGKVYATATAGFTVSSIHRGQHQLQVAVIDAEQQVQARSATITIFVYRPSVINP